MTRATLISAFLMLMAALNGCTFIPEMRTPQLAVQDQWTSEPPLSETTAQGMEAVSRQAFFLSQPMQELIDLALEHNRDLRVAVLQVEAARALYRVEKADLLPTVDAELSGYSQRTPEAQNDAGVGATRYSIYSANVAVTSFELDLFGRIRSLNQAALETYLATEAARDAVRTTLVAEVADAYLEWLADRKVLEVSRSTLAAQEKTLELIQKSYESGVASKLELAQVRTTVESARASAALYARQVALDRNALRLLVGDHAGLVLSEADTLDEVKVLERLPVGLPSEVLLYRPDVRRAEHELRAANADIGAARAAFFPTISLTGSLGFASDEFSKLFSSSAAGAWTFAPSISVPIFSAGRNKANLEYAETQKDIAVARYEKAVQQAFREVADQLDSRAALDAELTATRDQEEAARDAYDLSLARYKGGVDSYLSVLTAQRLLFAAQTRRIEIERMQLANMVNLYKALGGGGHP